MSTTGVAVVLGVLVWIGAAGCGGDAEGSGSAWVAAFDTAADTITVRTVDDELDINYVVRFRIGTS